MKASKWIGMTPLIALAATAWPILASAQTGQERREEQQRDQGLQQQKDQQQYGQQPGQPGQVATRTERSDLQKGNLTERPWTEPASRWQKSSDLKGKNVQGSGGDKIGDVDDLIVDLDSGRVIYVIVSTDGKLCDVPATALDLQQDAKHFTIAATKDQLKAYSFEKNQFPNFSDRTWATQVYGHYNQQPYWERSGGTGAGADLHPWYRFTNHWMKATDIMGKDVKNPQNENLGEIEDLAVDPDRARVIYAVLSFGGVLGIGDKLFAIPMSSLDVSGDQKHFVLNMDKERLKNAQGFDKNNWPNMADQRWSTETHTFYQQRPYWEEPQADSQTGTRDIGQEGVRGEQKTEVWVCTMHPSVRESKTGKCPICQMTLVREDTQSKP